MSISKFLEKKKLITRTQKELAQILAYGGSLDLSAEGYTQDHLLQIAAKVAAGRGKQFRLGITSKPMGDLENISAAGRPRHLRSFREYVLGRMPVGSPSVG